MKLILTKILNKIQNSPFIVFISLIDLLISVLEKLYEILKGKLNLNNLDMELSYFEITVRIITVVFLFFLWRNFLKTKKSVEKNLNKINKHWYKQLKNSSKELTQNINESNRLLSNQIRFIHFNNEHKDLPKNEYLKKLTLVGGFSKDDLLEIGIDENLLNENDNLIFSKKVMQKFIDFQKELK
jgi:hypothetical protein